MAFEPVTREWLDERTIFDDDGLLVVDKPFGVVVHGGSEAAADDLVTALKCWLASRGHDQYLGVHQRLDQDASGVLLFTRCRAYNAPVSKELGSHSATRVYLAAVTDPGLAARGELKSRLSPLKRGRVRVVRTGGKHAVTRYRVLERSSGRVLLELRPETGRTHQLRVQLASVGAPIAGDRLYGGAPAGRLMLHAHELRLASLRRSFSAPVPRQLSEWVRGEPPRLPPPAELQAALLDAAWKRRRLAAQTSAYRLANDLADALPGVSVDRYGDYALLNTASDEAFDRREELARRLLELGARGVYLKHRVRADVRQANVRELAPPEPIAGEAASDPLEVWEGKLRYEVSLGAGLSPGLFVDQRENRARLVRGARGIRVLNLFCYTCSFSVAAAVGGAAEVVSVDLSGRALERGRANFARSGVESAPYRFVKADAIDWLRRARRRGEQFDWVVLDPPSFAQRGKRGTFRVADDYRRVARDALAVLAPQGRLLAVTNHRQTTSSRLRRILHEAARDAGREVAQMKSLPSPRDCPPAPDGPWPSKSVMVTLS